jgi:hypothetical protein
MIRRHCIWICVFAHLYGFGAPNSAAQVVYDPAADFSASNNPNGVWSYGWTQTLASAFNMDTNFQNGSGLIFWVGPFPFGGNEFMPYVAHNGTASTINYQGGLQYLPGQLGLHPGPGGEYAVIRFTAPLTTTISVAGAYAVIPSQSAATTDVHILHNNVSVFSGALGPASSAPFSLQRSVLAGDTIDFAVGFGGNGFFGDSTRLSAAITSVPEPGAMTLTGLLFAAALCRKLRTRKARAMSAHWQRIENY